MGRENRREGGMGSREGKEGKKREEVREGERDKEGEIRGWKGRKG